MWTRKVWNHTKVYYKFKETCHSSSFNILTGVNTGVCILKIGKLVIFWFGFNTVLTDSGILFVVNVFENDITFSIMCRRTTFTLNIFFLRTKKKSRQYVPLLSWHFLYQLLRQITNKTKRSIYKFVYFFTRETSFCHIKFINKRQLLISIYQELNKLVIYSITPISVLNKLSFEQTSIYKIQTQMSSSYSLYKYI